MNLLVAVLVTVVLRARPTPEGTDQTHPDDHRADEGSTRLQPVADVLPIL